MMQSAFACFQSYLGTRFGHGYTRSHQDPSRLVMTSLRHLLPSSFVQAKQQVSETKSLHLLKVILSSLSGLGGLQGPFRIVLPLWTPEVDDFPNVL